MLESSLIVVLAGVIFIASFYLMSHLIAYQKIKHLVEKENDHLSDFMLIGESYYYMTHHYHISAHHYNEDMKISANETLIKMGFSAQKFVKNFHLFDINDSFLIIKKRPHQFGQTLAGNSNIFFEILIKKHYKKSIQTICNLMPDCDAVNGNRLIITQRTPFSIFNIAGKYSNRILIQDYVRNVNR